MSYEMTYEPLIEVCQYFSWTEHQF